MTLCIVSSVAFPYSLSIHNFRKMQIIPPRLTQDFAGDQIVVLVLVSVCSVPLSVIKYFFKTLLLHVTIYINLNIICDYFKDGKQYCMCFYYYVFDVFDQNFTLTFDILTHYL